MSLLVCMCTIYYNICHCWYVCVLYTITHMPLLVRVCTIYYNIIAIVVLQAERHQRDGAVPVPGRG